MAVGLVTDLNLKIRKASGFWFYSFLALLFPECGLLYLWCLSWILMVCQLFVGWISMLNGFLFEYFDKSKAKKKQRKGPSQRIGQKRRDMSCIRRLTKEEREVGRGNEEESVRVALKRDVGGCGMGRVGKPMGKSKWVGVELISYSSGKGPTLLPILLFC